MRFTFIHAADLHIDSPLAGLRLKDDEVARTFADAGRRAVQALVEEAVASNAAFLIVAGDVFDGSWKDVGTGLFFVRALGTLDRAGIPTFIVKGNHDAESLIARDLPYPPSVTVFRSKAADTITLDECRVAIHGRSFPHRLTAEFVETYPKRRDGWLNIGVLHTSLDGTRGHEGYAPCSIDDLRRFGYDYWALGHVHTAEIVSKDPWIVFPGNLQGRNIREAGPKGAMRVTVEDGHIVGVEPIVLDGARWANLEIDVADIAFEADVLKRLDDALAQACSSADGRPLAIRLTLTGASDLHNHLIAHRERLLEDVRACALRFAADSWIEQLKVKTTLKPSSLRIAMSGEDISVTSLIEKAAGDPSFVIELNELVEAVKAKLPRDLQEEFLASDLVKSLTDEAKATLAGELG